MQISVGLVLRDGNMEEPTQQESEDEDEEDEDEDDVCVCSFLKTSCENVMIFFINVWLF